MKKEKDKVYVYITLKFMSEDHAAKEVKKHYKALKFS